MPEVTGRDLTISRDAQREPSAFTNIICLQSFANVSDSFRR